MTEAENKIYNAITDLSNKVAVLLAEQAEIKTYLEEHEMAIKELNTIRDKGIGALWLGGLISGSGFLAGIGAMIYSWTKH